MNQWWMIQQWDKDIEDWITRKTLYDSVQEAVDDLEWLSRDKSHRVCQVAIVNIGEVYHPNAG